MCSSFSQQRRTLLLVVIFGLIFNYVTAQVPPPIAVQPDQFTTVRWVIRHRDNLNVDNRFVHLVGTVVRPVGDESYWFTDGTGYIRLDSERFELPLGRRVVINGRIDEAYLGFGHLEVDVRGWYYAEGQNVPPPLPHPEPPPAQWRFQ